VILVYLGQAYEILGLAMDNRGCEFDMGFVVGAVLCGNREGAGGRVGYGGLLGVIGSVLYCLASTSIKDVKSTSSNRLLCKQWKKL